MKPSQPFNARTVCIVVGLTAIASQATLAKDSLWMLGDDGDIAVSTFEHRNERGDGRDTEVTLIFGMHTLQGTLHDADSGKIRLAEIGPNKAIYVFTGTVSVPNSALQAKLIHVAGVLDFGTAGNRNLDTSFPCKVMKND